MIGELILAFFAWLAGLFRKDRPESGAAPPPGGTTIVIGGGNTPPVSSSTSTPPATPDSPATELPYPEEPFDPAQTAGNVDPVQVMFDFLENYQVPDEYRAWWLNSVTLDIVEGLNAPELTVAELRSIQERPGHANSGVTAHAAGHIVWPFLTPDEQNAFPGVVAALRNTYPRLDLVFTAHPYAGTSRVEAHAEIFRYLGPEMPTELRKYYPKLINP